jgi:hypothetical protein
VAEDRAVSGAGHQEQRDEGAEGSRRCHFISEKKKKPSTGCIDIDDQGLS